MSDDVPKISVLALAEYLEADIVRRGAIVREARDTNEAAMLRYNRARQRLLQILRSSPPYGVPLADAAERLREQIPSASSDWNVSDLELSAEALDRLRDLLPSMDLADRVVRQRRQIAPLDIEHVQVSVAPDLLIRTASDSARLGAIKFRFSSGREMGDVEGDYASTILRYYLREQLSKSSLDVSYKHCQVVDIFSGTVFQAKRYYKRRMNRVRKACEEFALHWQGRAPTPDIQPTPPDRIQPQSLH